MKRRIDSWLYSLNFWQFGLLAFMLILIIMLGLTDLAHAQSSSSYDFTISNDTDLCGSACSTVSGSGVFTIGQSVIEVKQTMFSITNLSGTLNGLPLSLSNLGGANSNLFFTPAEPIAPFYPLFVQSGSQQWNFQMADSGHTGGTGQTMYSYQSQTFTPVSLTVQPVSQPLLSRRNPMPPLSPVRVSLPKRAPTVTPSPISASLPSKKIPAFRSNHNFEIGISVTAAVATGIAIYEWRHHRQHWDAVPAGRLR